MLHTHSSEKIVDQIYDAPFEPNMWIGVMEQLCDLVGANTACLTSLDIVDGSGEGITARADQSSVTDYMANWTDRNSLLLVDDPISYARDWRLAIIRDREWLPPELLHKTSYYNEFLRPLGADHSMMVRLSLDGAMVSALNIARTDRKGPFEDAEIARIATFQPHLVRAMNVANRLRLSQTALDEIDTLLETSTKALFFVNRRGNVGHYTAAAETLLRTQKMLTLRQRRLELADPHLDARLQYLVRETIGGSVGPRDQSFVVLTSDSQRLVVSAHRLGSRSVGAFSSEPILVLDVAEAPVAVSAADHLRFFYKLTSAEARVALLLAEGMKMRQIAERCGISVHTVRAQLGAVFAKTDCHRQSDLVRLLLQQRISPPAMPTA